MKSKKRFKLEKKNYNKTKNKGERSTVTVKKKEKKHRIAGYGVKKVVWISYFQAN